MEDDPILQQTATDAVQPETDPLQSPGHNHDTVPVAVNATESSSSTSVTAEAKPCNSNGRDTASVQTAVFPQSLQRQQQLQLLAATGGAERSCYKCLAPFSVALLVSGAAVSGLAYGRGTHGSAVGLLGVGMLALGALLAVCCLVGWIRHHRSRRMKLRRDSFAVLVGRRHAGEVLPNAAV